MDFSSLASSLGVTSWSPYRWMWVTTTILMGLTYFIAWQRDAKPFLGKASKVFEHVALQTKLSPQRAFEVLSRAGKVGRGKLVATDPEKGALVFSQSGDALQWGTFFSVVIRLGTYNVTTVDVHLHPKIYQRGRIIRGYLNRFGKDIQVILNQTASS